MAACTSLNVSVGDSFDFGLLTLSLASRRADITVSRIASLESPESPEKLENAAPIIAGMTLDTICFPSDSTIALGLLWKGVEINIAEFLELERWNFLTGGRRPIFLQRSRLKAA